MGKEQGERPVAGPVEELEIVELLDQVSVFAGIAAPEDIEFYRQALEAQHGCKLVVYRKTSDAVATHVEWRIVE
jgi:hypothetical protein